MNPLWFLPSIALGVFYALASGNWLMLTASLLTAAVTWIIAGRNSALPEGNLRIAGNRVWLGQRALPRLQLFWSAKLHEGVIKKFHENQPPSLDSLRLLRNSGWQLGRPNGYLVGVEQPFALDQGAGHLLVIGPTGSGKSELLHLVIASLDSGVELALADYKGAAVLTETKVSNSTSDLETLERQNSFWLELEDQLAHRESWLRANGFASWEQAERQGKTLPRRLVIVDEVVSAIRSTPKAAETLVHIASKGRSLGMHLLVTSQTLMGIPREVLVNLRSRLALSGTDEVELLQLGCKEKIGISTAQSKAAVLLHDGQTLSVQVPLGARRAPRSAAEISFREPEPPVHW